MGADNRPGGRLVSTTWALVRKDLLLFVRDRTALFFAFALPIILASVMGTALGGAMGSGGGSVKIKKIALAVEDRSQTDASRSLVKALEGADGLRIELVEDARRLVADGDRAGGLVIGAEYADDPESLTLYRDPVQQIASQVMLFQLAPALLGNMADTMGSGMMSRFLETLEFPEAGRAAAEGVLTASFDRIEAIAGELEPSTPAAGDEADPSDSSDPADDETPAFDPLTAVPDILGLKVEDIVPPTKSGLPRSAGASHAFAAMAVMMLLFNAVAAAGTLLEERTEGTLDRLRLTPSAGRAVLLGKGIVTILLALAQLVVLFTFGVLVYRIPVLEHLPAIACTSLAWAFAAASLGLLFATGCRTRKQMEGLSTLVVLGMSAIGGAWFPREITPDWFQAAGLLTPVAWAMDGFEGALWYGKGVFATADQGGILLSLVVLIGFGAVLLGLSGWFYRRRFAS